MKYKLLPFLLALITGAAILTSCAGGNSGATQDEAVNRVYPDGEGKYYSEETTLTDTGTGTDVPSSAQASTEKTSSNTDATQPTTVHPGTQPTTTPSTQPTTNPNVPKDNITGANINPGIGSIQGDVMSKIRALTLKSVSLNKSSVTLEVGKSEKLEISYDPENALTKSCTASVSSGAASASVSGSTVTVTGKSAGSATLTITSRNGCKATCSITVKNAEQPRTDDTVLPHGELCTADNANRWNAAVVSRLSGLGMKQNANLSGSEISFGTAELPGSQSYRTAEKALCDLAEKAVSSQVEGDYSGFEFKCSATRSNGECVFTVTIAKSE